MTPPRRIRAGSTWAISVRAVGRTYRLRPDKRALEAIEYCIREISRRYGGDIGVHCWMFMSNHIHLTLTDHGTRLPDYMRDLNSMLARAINAVRGVSGTVFETRYSAVEITDPHRVMEAMVYANVNPVAAGIVARAGQWKGSSSIGIKIGEPTSFKRPEHGLWKYVDKIPPAPRKTKKGERSKGRKRRRGRSKCPEITTMVLEKPPWFEHMSDTDFQELLDQLTREQEDKLMAQREAEGRKLVGMARALAVDWWAFPEISEDLFKTTPHLASSSSDLRVAAIKELRRWRKRYAEARARWIAGDRDVEFPDGTWLMRKMYNVRVESVAA